MSSPDETRILLPAPVLSDEQRADLDRFMTGCAVLRGLDPKALIAHGVLPGAIAARRFRDDPLRWLGEAEDIELDTFWLLVEEHHAVRQAAQPSDPPGAPQ